MLKIELDRIRIILIWYPELAMVLQDVDASIIIGTIDTYR